MWLFVMLDAQFLGQANQSGALEMSYCLWYNEDYIYIYIYDRKLKFNWFDGLKNNEIY